MIVCLWNCRFIFRHLNIRPAQARGQNIHFLLCDSFVNSWMIRYPGNRKSTAKMIESVCGSTEYKETEYMETKKALQSQCLQVRRQGLEPWTP